MRFQEGRVGGCEDCRQRVGAWIFLAGKDIVFLPLRLAFPRFKQGGNSYEEAARVATSEHMCIQE